jgi:hypothetical protein
VVRPEIANHQKPRAGTHPADHVVSQTEPFRATIAVLAVARSTIGSSSSSRSGIPHRIVRTPTMLANSTHRCALYPPGCGGDESSCCHGTAFPALCPRSLANTAQNVLPTEAEQLVSAWPLRFDPGRNALWAFRSIYHSHQMFYR